MALQANNLCVSRDGKPILRDITVTLVPGRMIGLLGANGAGKSTLLAALAGELTLDAGHVELNGTPLASLSAKAQARQRAVLPQNPALSFDLCAHEVVSAGAYPFPELAPAAVEQLVHEAMTLAGVADLYGSPYLSLSAGQQQRVQFARVLAQMLVILPDTNTQTDVGRADGTTDAGAGAEAEYLPRYLLLDEPISALDPRHQIELLRTTSELTDQRHIGALISLHDINLAAHWCDELILLGGGTIIAYGTPAQVLTPANLRSIYDIDADVLRHPTQPGRLLVLPR
ncbi:heme ABC transporter ATP-binding protein [Bordetella sp. 02P26C-1]|uniref:heme ABC transporter ATP-binding protein n=1 Tax=Bordetella sp. 02P26C-1 TaxID=2683195 RepID=UPI001354BF68|nr:heme ABC transporter ATP-binding protein [Bordetella sp. 02P26C-1]MVW78620.1 ATP-binding cassette domain-containing protein [Bordetella sp. 02P26C-1]